MLHILGAGWASPETRLDNAFLAELGLGAVVAEHEATSGIKSRRSVLPLEYIKSTKNIDPIEASRVAVESPTDLALRAAKMAIERAGILPEQISCIIGDGATPFQSTPSEAQRVGEKLGLKVPAYDVAACAGPIPLHLEMLGNLREEKVPEYCLCLTSHTPSCRVNYTSGSEGFFLGDGAAALVISAKHARGLSVADASFNCDYLGTADFNFDSHASAKFSGRGLKLVQEKLLEAVSAALKRAGAKVESMKLVLGQVGSGIEQNILKSLGLSQNALFSEHAEYGFTLSAAPAGILARYWNDFRNGETIICAYAGPGLSYGSAILKVNKDI